VELSARDNLLEEIDDALTELELLDDPNVRLSIEKHLI